MMFIAVIGEGFATRENYKIAEEVGRLIAKAKAVLICGGKEGVMEAAAKGANKAKGLTVGILPSGDRNEANRYIDIPIITGLGYARNKIIVKTGQVVIAVGGGYGTLSEIAFALCYGIPVIGIKTWQLFKNGKIEPSVIYKKNAKEAVSLAMDFIKKGRGDKVKIEMLWRKYVKSAEHKKRIDELKRISTTRSNKPY